MEYSEFSGKTVDDAITEACQTLMVTSDKLDYEVVDEGSNGFLGLHAKNAVIKAKVKDSVQDRVSTFLYDVLHAMNLEANVIVKYDEDAKEMDIEITGDDIMVSGSSCYLEFTFDDLTDSEISVYLDGISGFIKFCPVRSLTAINTEFQQSRVSRTDRIDVFSAGYAELVLKAQV